jgi:hypothetical protein
MNDLRPERKVDAGEANTGISETLEKVYSQC